MHVLYLHGFLSSPQSVKAQQTKAWCVGHRPEIQLHIPQLSNFPAQVGPQLEAYLAENPALTEQGIRAIGSSMGGFLSTWLVERFGGKAVLINPAVKPYELLVNYIGEHINPYTQELFSIVPEDMEVLRAMDTPAIKSPKQYKVLLQTGDETLDYRQAEGKYSGGDVTIEEGGNHSFVNFDAHLPRIFQFLD
ncbi:YqiA/YcfP family alpha/beta fold hydrolase [Aestuariibacter sp. A3R04]|uniref:YqiA/YcfP family alpha/beta fold hydrolase n=1 Tax=Aestuariibacter sp. A3R04 TaxID=2841571 RepID=UPI001C092DCA|nr:YqiA/YcfP family alpha/beta fold hydrolase [Aestuariibacter sp. A3R04]MBU3021105.1 esterase YqiA [Aestuariibacter sp. A3R04]